MSHHIRVSIQDRRILTTLGTVVALGLLLAPPRAMANSQRVAIRTDDGISLAATWYEPGTRAPAVILVHMLHKSRRDWDAVATSLASQGIGALAIDLRGHGESSGSIPEGQTAADYSVLVRDLIAARHYLSSRGDVQPPIVLGKALREAGHMVKVVSHVPFKPLVEQCGLSFAPCVHRAHAANDENHIVCPAARRRVRIRCRSNLPNGLHFHRRSSEDVDEAHCRLLTSIDANVLLQFPANGSGSLRPTALRCLQPDEQAKACGRSCASHRPQ